jgi:hypothetical protein
VRKGAGLSIDVLAAESEIRAGKFTATDIQRLNSILPGLYTVLKKRADKAAREAKDGQK